MARKKSEKTASKNMTQISISLPKKLVDIIDKMGELENRNRSNFISNTLSNIAKEFGQKNK